MSSAVNLRAGARMGLRLLVVALIIFGSTTARADDQDDARAAMRRGLEAARRDDPAAALTEFQVARRLAPSANAPLFHAAAALERLGRFKEAVDDLETYLALDPSVSDAAAVRAHISALRAAHFPGTLALKSNVVGTRFEVDGALVAADLRVELEPGPHLVVAKAPHGPVSSRFVRIVGGQVRAEAFTFEVVAPPLVDVQPPSRGPWPALGWTLATLGAAGVTASFVIDATVLGDSIDDYRRASAAADPASPALLDEVHTQRAAVITGYAVGSLLLAGGVLLAVLAPRKTGRNLGLQW